MATTTVDLGVFAHDEADTIGGLVADLGRQTLLADGEADARVVVLANGCRDDTAERARTAIAALAPDVAARFAVVEFAQGGKSRTWNRFVHEVSRAGAGTLVFVDADIALPEPDTLARLATAVETRPDLDVMVSTPIKDAALPGARVGVLARFIARTPSVDSGRTAICGQLYAMRAARARGIAMPVGLPVEDGFLRAMVLTDCLSAPEDLRRIDRDPAVFHVFESIRSAPELLRHQQRIVVGSAINAVLFAVIRREAPDEAAARALLFQAAEDEGWLARTLAAELPRAPHGYVPFHFLTKRLRAFLRRPAVRPKALATLILGLGLDAAAWTGASLRLARGAGAGHW